MKHLTCADLSYLCSPNNLLKALITMIVSHVALPLTKASHREGSETLGFLHRITDFSLRSKCLDK